jgi:FkbM family methyltransferase
VYGVINLNISGTRFKVFSKSDDFIANELFYGLGYETAEFELIKAITANSSVFVDVGANTGIFSLFAACANPDLRVYSLEPHPGNFARLKKNLAINGQERIIAMQRALGDKTQTIKFTIPSDNSLSTTSSANSAFTTNFHNVPFKEIDVDQTTLDELAKEVPISMRDVVKIDVEYYELQVLMGSKSILTSNRPFVILEILSYQGLVSQHAGMKDKIPEDYAERIVNLMDQHGYYRYQLSSDAIIRANKDVNGRNFLYSPIDMGEGPIKYQDLKCLMPQS